MRPHRVIIRTIELIAITASLYALLVVGLALLLPFSNARSRWRAKMFGNWAKAAAAILNIRIRAEGRAPSPPFLLVSNHLSYVDVLVFGSQVDCVFVARGDAARWPVIGFLCRSVGTIFVDRDKRSDVARVNRLIDRALKQGLGVVLFAEGTSTQGAAVNLFKSSLLEQAARAGLAVSFASLTYSTLEEASPANLSVCWWGDMTFWRHVAGLIQLSEIHATVRFGEGTIRNRDRKALAEQLWIAVMKQFTPVVVVEEKCRAAMR
jgi:1-acyl-sn-glycerol-3-phosphate acyltransferase